MERTHSVNYPVQRQNKGVLLNTFKKHHGRTIQHCTSIREARRDRQIECTERNIMTVVFTNVFNNTPLFCLSIGWLILHSVLSIYLVSSLQYPHTIQQITISIRQKAYYPHNIQHITISIRQKVYYPHNIQPRRIQYIPKSSLLIADYNIYTIEWQSEKKKSKQEAPKYRLSSFYHQQ